MYEIINPTYPTRVPEKLYERYTAMCDIDAYTTAHVYTVTNANTAGVAPVSYTGRPALGVTYNSAITDGLQCQVPVASVIPQAYQPVVVKASFASSIMGTAELAFGLHVVDTSIIAGKGTDYVLLEKVVGGTTFTLQYRKASGTAESQSIPMPALASATWYDMVLILKKDPSTAGKGIVTVGFKAGGSEGDAMQWMHDYPVATQFPDTVATAPFIATRSGFAAAVNYFGYLAWQL